MMSTKARTLTLLGAVFLTILLISLMDTKTASSIQTEAEYGGFLYAWDGAKYLINNVHPPGGNAIDIVTTSTPQGEFDILAVKDGIVIDFEDRFPRTQGVSGCPSNYKDFMNYMLLGHGYMGNDSYQTYTLYYHLKQGSVSASGISDGMFVRLGQKIGVAGDTGEWNNTIHLHMEMSANPKESTHRPLSCNGVNLPDTYYYYFEPSDSISVGFEEEGNQWPLLDGATGNLDNPSSFNWQGIQTNSCDPRTANVILYNHVDFGGECVVINDPSQVFNVPGWMHVSSVYLNPNWTVDHFLTIYNGPDLTGDRWGILWNSISDLREFNYWNDNIKSTHNAYTGVSWLTEFSIYDNPPLETNLHVVVQDQGDFDAMRVCFNGGNCQETAATELYYVWPTHLEETGDNLISVQYRRDSHNHDWNNAEKIEYGYHLVVDHSYAPCGSGDGVTLTSGPNCVLLTQTVRDLGPAGWGDRWNLYISVTGDLEAWAYNSVDFEGAPYVIKGGESGPVGNNVSSIEVKPLSPDPPENPYQPFDADGDTVGLWHFDEGSGTTLYDSAGSYDGSLASGNSWVSGKFDDGLYFPNPPDGGGVNFGAMYVCPITFEAWIKTTNDGGRLAGQLGGGQNTGVNKWLLYVDNNKPKLEIWSSGGSQATTGYKEMTDGNWHYLMWTYDCSTTAKLYMDNELVGNLTTASQWDGAGSATTFEVGSPGQQSRCNCDIDDVRISNIVRVPVAQPTPTPTPEPTQTATPTPTATPVPNTVILFESAGYYATQYGWNTPGTYGLPSEMNDRASALQVTSGWSVMLYSDGSQQGASVCRNADDSDFAGDTYNGGAGLNDSVSSVEVFDDPNCGSATPTSTPTTAPTVISLFEDSAYAGNTATFSSEGVYNLSSFNDIASSLQVASGWSVMLYEHSDKGGDSICRIADDANFNDGDTFDGATPLNDRVSSIEVFHDMNCNGQLANTVILFESAGYYASQYGWNVPGSYELPSEMNDRASALKVTSGWSVKLYSDGSQQGSSVCRSADDSDFSGDTYDGGSGLNDSVSSVQVFLNSNCTP